MKFGLFGRVKAVPINSDIDSAILIGFMNLKKGS